MDYEIIDISPLCDAGVECLPGEDPAAWVSRPCAVSHSPSDPLQAIRQSIATSHWRMAIRR